MHACSHDNGIGLAKYVHGSGQSCQSHRLSYVYVVGNATFRVSLTLLVYNIEATGQVSLAAIYGRQRQMEHAAYNCITEALNYRHMRQ